MKLFVIGNQGQLARALGEVAPSPEVAVVAIGRPELDLLTPGTVFRAIDRYAPDVVINAAAYTAVDKAESEPELAYAVNAAGAAHVAAACGNTPLIHISTDYVFGGGGPHLEGDHVEPLGVYGRSKLEGERRIAEQGQRHIILRTAWLHSPFGHNFVRTILRLADSRPELGIVDDQIGNPTYAPHLAAAILTIARHIHTRPIADLHWGIYHAAGSGEATWFRFAQEILRQSVRLGRPQTGLRPITTAEYTTSAKRPADSRLDCSKCERIFDVRLPDWKIGLAECVSRCVASGAARTLRSAS